jgi:hypothetical protein
MGQIILLYIKVRRKGKILVERTLSSDSFLTVVVYKDRWEKSFSCDAQAVG